MRVLQRRPLVVAAIGSGVLAATVLAISLLRPHTVAVELRYAPPDAATIAFVRSADALWHDGRGHFCLLADGGIDGCKEDSETTPLNQLRDAGIDTARPMVVSFRGPITAGDFIFVAPIADPEKFHAHMRDWRQKTFHGAFVPPEGGVRVGATREDASGRRSNTHRVFPAGSPCSDALRHTVASDAVRALEVVTSGAGAPGVAVRRLDPASEAVRAGVEMLELIAAEAGEQGEEAPVLREAERIVAVAAEQSAQRVTLAGRVLDVSLAGGGICYALVDHDRTALVFTRLETLDLTLRSGGARDALASQEAFTRAVNYVAPASSEPPAQAWLFTRQPGPVLQSAAPVAFLNFWTDPRSMRVRGWFAGSFTMSRLLASATGASAETDLPPLLDKEFDVAMGWRDLGEALRFVDGAFPQGLVARAFGATETDELSGHYRGVVQALLEREEVGRVNLSIHDFNNGVPEIVLAVGMSPGGARAFVNSVRRSEQRARDRRILAHAAAKPAAGELSLEGWADGSNAQRLVAANLIARDPGGGEWVRSFNDQSELSEPAPGCLERGAAFTSPFACSQGDAFSFLMPPATADDVRYFEERHDRDLSPADERALIQEDRYRVAAIYSVAQETLFVGPDLQTLRRVVDPRAVQFAPNVSRIPGAERRLSAQINPAWLYAQQALQAPDADSEFQVPSAFANYSAVTVLMDALPANHGMVLDVTASR